ncbi:VWA3B, partial [Symbiodinium sp. CCMP2592]
ALVPVDERLGDIFRDLDEATVILEPGGGHPTQAYSNQLQRGTFLTTTAVEGGLRRSLDLLERADVPKDVARLSCHAAPTTQSTRHHFPVIAPKHAEREGGRIVPITANVTLPPQVIDDESDDEEDDYFDEGRLAPPEDYPPLPRAPPFAPPGAEAVPGPNEEFEAERMPYETMQVDHPVDPVQLTSYDNDWLVEHLTPRLRDFIISRFQPDLITEPKFVASIGKYVSAKYLQTSGSFVSVFMRPQTSLSSDPNTTMPVHYNLPKAQIVLFMRQAETHIEELEQHQEYLRASLRALRALLSTAAGGLSENDFVNVLLPMNYHAFTEAEGSMLEAEKPLLRLSSGKNTVIIIDTSGAVAEHLPYVKAAIKRTLHAHMCGKETFQLIRFTKTGEPRLWAQDMMAPTETAFECAETWIDRLESADSGNVAQAVRCALAFKSCDEIHIISSGTCFRPVEHDHLLSSLRYLNKREVAIHTSGVDPNPHSERLLRNIAESNHGDFTLKFFRDQGIGRANVIPSNHAKWTSWRTMLVNEKSRQLSDAFKKQKMSIGSQMKILVLAAKADLRWETGARLLDAAKTTRRVSHIEAFKSRAVSKASGVDLIISDSTLCAVSPKERDYAGKVAADTLFPVPVAPAWGSSFVGGGFKNHLLRWPPPRRGCVKAVGRLAKAAGETAARHTPADLDAAIADFREASVSSELSSKPTADGAGLRQLGVSGGLGRRR